MTQVLLFTRWPEPGKAKTRLIPALGPEGAAHLQRRMTGALVLELRCSLGADVIRVLHTDPDERRMQRWLGDDLHYLPQGEGDLGQRLQRAFADAFSSGAKQAFAVGGDCPQIDEKVLRSAHASLQEHQIVIVPAHDGGYCLIGMKTLHVSLFQNIAWGSEQVLSQTLAAAEGLSVCLLPPMHDIDVPEDLPHLDAEWPAPRPGSTSVVIPTLNEALHLPATLRAVMPEADEVIVIDGGSSDETLAIAHSHGARVINAPKANRGLQMNLGARAARSENLLFLHADTLPPPGFSHLIATPSIGAFRFGIAGEGWALRCIEWGTHLRCRHFHLPYGDQGLFVKRDRFQACGGFTHAPLMEDYEWVRRMQQLGDVITLPQKSQTSSRRWQHLGPFRTMWRNQGILIAHALGVPKSRLATWYKK